jgi:glycosyltransferase involved in cell wall biosynthesis
VIPSLIENLPFTVIECLGEGVPFLASTAGGIPELIDAAQHDRLLVPLRADLWAAALARVLTEGAERGRLAFDPEANRAAWLDWHTSLAPPAATVPALTPPRRGGALVSVCVPHHNRPDLLDQALASLRRQDYPNLEVVLVDDASTDPEAVAHLERLRPEFAQRGWRLERSPVNRFATATRNAAARLARGEYLLFMDDDNVARPHEVSTLVRVAEHTGADLVGCFVDLLEGTDPPDPADPGAPFAFLGPALSLGLWRNALGDTNTLMRREAFFALGSFTEDYGVSHEDHEFLVRAVLRGYRLEIVPEPLFWYRRTPNSVHHGADPVANFLRVLRPYLAAVPAELRPALQYAQSLLLAELAPEKWRGRPFRYRVADRLAAALKNRPSVYALARSLARWGTRVFRAGGAA